MSLKRDHGGGLDAAVLSFGGPRSDWIDLSTGINPHPYPMPELKLQSWTSLPDEDAIRKVEGAARAFWSVPPELDIVAAGGASSLIAALPRILKGETASVSGPTYNEHQAAFEANDWTISQTGPDVQVVVHPNNPDGRRWHPSELTAPQLVIDESFCDTLPDLSFVLQNEMLDRSVVLKSFGKFWGLAGLRLGFGICRPQLANALREQLGPWAVSGPACEIGSLALNDEAWANATRRTLRSAAKRLADLTKECGLRHVGGTDLFCLVDANSAQQVFQKLAQAKILVRTFPYSSTWVRIGLPGAEDEWSRLKSALSELT